MFPTSLLNGKTRIFLPHRSKNLQRASQLRHTWRGRQRLTLFGSVLFMRMNPLQNCPGHVHFQTESMELPSANPRACAAATFIFCSSGTSPFSGFRLRQVVQTSLNPCHNSCEPIFGHAEDSKTPRRQPILAELQTFIPTHANPEAAPTHGILAPGDSVTLRYSVAALGRCHVCVAPLEVGNADSGVIEKTIPMLAWTYFPVEDNSKP